jgi:hypothetical protein
VVHGSAQQAAITPASCVQTLRQASPVVSLTPVLALMWFLQVTVFLIGAYAKYNWPYVWVSVFSRSWPQHRPHQDPDV